MLGEICDDGDTDSGDGCHQCIDCYVPYDDMVVTGDVRLCPGVYTIGDGGDEGVISVEGIDTTLDCDGAKLIGVGVGVATQISAQIQVDTNIEEEEQTGGFFAQVIGFISSIFTGGAEEEDTTNTGGGTTVRSGTGIYVQAENALVKDCEVTEYRNGIKVDYIGNVLVNNEVCGNTYDIKSTTNDNFGVKNLCDESVNWMENGVSGCTYLCDGTANEQPSCPECPVCEEVEEAPEEQPEEEPEEEILEQPEEAPEEPEEETTTTTIKYKCPDGRIVLTKEECFETTYLCPDGTKVTDKTQCPAKIECADGTIVYDEADCPTVIYLCPDGTKVTDKTQCPAKIECADGTIVYDKADCPYDVCCVLSTGSYSKMTNVECSEKLGKVVADSYCAEPQESNVCCKIVLKTGTDYSTMTSSDCKAKFGTVVDDSNCEIDLLTKR
ncbi:hypothetical protein KY345_05055, partial [Candidatus Woesearchaeota archaeon]|nr:hypothetical protein [Candidatus Woesearchaeota archaeon]